jgi:hypothetical protein
VDREASSARRGSMVISSPPGMPEMPMAPSSIKLGRQARMRSDQLVDAQMLLPLSCNSAPVMIGLLMHLILSSTCRILVDPFRPSCMTRAVRVRSAPLRARRQSCLGLRTVD